MHRSSDPIVQQIEEDVWGRFYRTTEAISKDELECYLNLVAALAGQEQERAQSHLLGLVHLSLQTDPDQWNTYCLRPLDVVSSPNHPFHEELEELVEVHLDFEISQQTNDGAWGPTWSWLGSYPDVWPTAEREWTGAITLRTIRTLHRFDRVAQEPSERRSRK